MSQSKPMTEGKPGPPDKTTVGVYRKYIVTRIDGKSEPGQKHHHCEYFVLDVNHDPHAKRALKSYAESCVKQYPLLAKDVMAMSKRCPWVNSKKSTAENQPAAMPPEPEFLHKAFYVQVDAFEWIAKCDCGWRKRVFNKIDAVLAECDLHDLENNAPTPPHPDLRAALVEARAALASLADDGVERSRDRRTLAAKAAMARIDAALEVKP